ncbi:hypothetical protein LZF95_23840 [Algoriphagus sp. AGSA1]|uniref:hypothetical protein n=1 Tax=Algoriphagus sp. AGSA1 TaxID=2907213 RepID=UPI001F28F648|nr:hypothetical protein [Algoriphagus sp. AGSA1]MCE7057736.1 hypothetical protein [Algoriphagus sp. AGSA1]
MGINKLLIENEERLLLISLIQGVAGKSEWIKNEDGTYFLLMDDDVAELLSERVKDKLVLEGFDYFYNLTPEGRIFERLVDKLGEIGW